MPKFGNFTVSIVNADSNEKFEEHKETTTDNKTECYIESISGQKFKIMLGLLAADDYQYSAEIFVDGRRIVGKLLGEINGCLRMENCCTGVEVAEGQVAPFLFGDTKFTGTFTERTNLTCSRGGIH
jgi:hypothetical protein